MKINIDRMAVLAGLDKRNVRRRLSESAGMEDQDEMQHFDESVIDDVELEEAAEEEDADESDIIEIDEVMLVQELRRAKKLMNEARRKNSRKNLQESKLQKIIEEEVHNVFSELNLNSDWVYGNKRPKRSKKGYWMGTSN